MGSALSISEFKAMSALSKQRSMLLVNMFSGTQLVFGRANAASELKTLASTGKAVYSNTRKLGDQTTKVAQAPGIKQAVEAFVRECADVENIADIAAAIGTEALVDLMAEITPVIGILWSGKKLAQATKAVVEDGYALYKHSYYRGGFRMGDPLAAADAIKTIIERDLTRHSIDLARAATATGAKIAGLFADMGTATTAGIGLANALAGLGLQLFALGLDIKDMRAGNRRLLAPDTLDGTIFGESPILGCYLLTCADTSSVINLFIADIGLPGWMDKVEKLKKDKMDPLLKISKAAIKTSNLQLDGLRSNKGTLNEKGFFAKVKSSMVKKLMG